MLTNPLWTLGGIVTLPLLGFSLLAVALIIERIVFWTTAISQKIIRM